MFIYVSFVVVLCLFGVVLFIYVLGRNFEVDSESGHLRAFTLLHIAR